MATSSGRSEYRDAPRRVVFIEAAAAMGGVQFSTLYLVQSLAGADWEPVIICPEDGDLMNACRKSKVRALSFDQPELRATSFRIGRDTRIPNIPAWLWDGFMVFVAALRVAKLLRQIEADLIVTKGLFPHFYGALGAHIAGIPCVWHVQDLISERVMGFYRRVFSLAARWLPDHIIVDGAAIGRQLPRSVQDHVSVIYNGVDTDSFSPDRDGAAVRKEFGLPVGAIVIGHLARMTPWKGQHYLVEAFATIVDEEPNAYLLFVGDPVFDTDTYQRQLLNLTAKLGLNHRVRFAGYRKDTAEMLAAMDIFAFTSVEKDTSPLALLSAMASGLSIAAFEIEGVREILKPEEECLFVPIADAGGLAQAISRLLGDKELRSQLGRNARRRAADEFNLTDYVSRMKEAFSRTLRQRQTVSGEGSLPEPRPHASSL